MQEDPDHVTVPGNNPELPPPTLTLSSVMDANERLDVEDEDERQNRLGAYLLHDAWEWLSSHVHRTAPYEG